jgi:hypothetical protein
MGILIPELLSNPIERVSAKEHDQRIASLDCNSLDHDETSLGI